MRCKLQISLIIIIAVVIVSVLFWSTNFIYFKLSEDHIEGICRGAYKDECIHSTNTTEDFESCVNDKLYESTTLTYEEIEELRFEICPEVMREIREANKLREYEYEPKASPIQPIRINPVILEGRYVHYSDCNNKTLNPYQEGRDVCWYNVALHEQDISYCENICLNESREACLELEKGDFMYKYIYDGGILSFCSREDLNDPSLSCGGSTEIIDCDEN